MIINKVKPSQKPAPAKKPVVTAPAKGKGKGTAAPAQKKAAAPAKPKEKADQPASVVEQPAPVPEHHKEEVEEEKEAPPPKEDVVGSAVVIYNIYKKAFPTLNGVMKAADIDDQYCISFVFEGAFKMHLKDPDGNNVEESADASEFYGVEDDKKYTL